VTNLVMICCRAIEETEEGKKGTSGQILIFVLVVKLLTLAE